LDLGKKLIYMMVIPLMPSSEQEVI